MMNPTDMRSVLTGVALKYVPPSIRLTLLEDPGFREAYGLQADAPLVFNNSSVAIQRSELFGNLRGLLSGASGIEVTDEDNRNWKLKNISEEGKLPSLVLSSGDQEIILPSTLVALSPDRSTRLRFLDEAASDVNLPIHVQEAWRNTLSNRTLEDDEIGAFHNELRETPIEMARSIHDEILSGQINISTLVPPSQRYFQRLVGTYDGSASIRDYATGVCRTLLDQLSKWRPYDGFLFSLFLSSHFSLTAEINIDSLSREDAVRAFEFLDKYGDRTSQLGAIEVGLRILRSRPEIESVLVRLVQQILNDDVDGKASQFSLLSSLFMFVDGELSRTRLLSSKPPYYRRLAALSQAALIQRQLMYAHVDIDHFRDWAFNSRAGQFYLQTLVDMRLEPRWHPDLADAAQLKAEFIGRILIAVKNHEQNIKNGELSKLIRAINSGSLLSASYLLRTYLPGPLEGVEDPHIILTTEIIEAIEEQLRAKDVGPSSFPALVNSALIFRVSADQAELAARALKLGSYHLANVENREQLLTILNGLASVAAVARSPALAKELRLISRKYRRDAQYALSCEEEMGVCLVSAASYATMEDWREFVGDWLTEIAFSDLKDNEGKKLQSNTEYLCHAAPELWVSCGRADAALISYNSSWHPD